MGSKETKVDISRDEENLADQPNLEPVISTSTKQIGTSTEDSEEIRIYDLSGRSTNDVVHAGNNERGRINEGAEINVDDRKNNGTGRNIGQMIIDPIMKPITTIVSPIANVGEQVVEHTIGYVIPNIERIPWIHFIILSCLVAVPATSYIIGFTKLGYGLDTFYFLSRYFEEHAYKLALALGGFAFLLYLLDFHYWQSKWGLFFRYLAIAILVLGTATLVCFISSTHPYGPISMYVVLTPMWLVLTKHLFYRHLEMRTYVPWLSGPLFFNAMVVLSVWLYWTFSTDAHNWTEITRLADAQRSGCVPDFDKYPECEADVPSGSNDDKRAVCFEIDQQKPKFPAFSNDCPERCMNVYDKCPNIFIVWVGPFLVSLGLFFLSFFATFLKVTGTIEQEAMKFAKIWFFLVFALWIAAALAGAGAGVSVTLAALTLSAFVASAILLASSFTHTERKEKVFQLWMNLMEKYRSYLNVAKGLLVVTSTPVFIVYLAVSFINQSIRNIQLPCSNRSPKPTQSLRNIMGEGIFTTEARRLIREVRSWDLVEVITYAIYWGIGFIVFTVVAPQFTTLVLSWIIEQTSTMTIGMVTGILLAVGVIMFLLPPVPGLPIYLTFGIVIVPVGKEQFGNGDNDQLAIIYSVLYAVGVSLLLKLFATFLQQKMIGGLLKGSVGIRQAVGINTPLIRAFKLLLSERGLGLAKVSILCGGPDWPTSVLCGVMDLSLMPVLVGTIPVLALIVPTVLAGSFTYLGSLKNDLGEAQYSWASTANTVSLAISAFVLFGFMFLAAYYVEVTVRERKDEIDKIPFDEDVKKYDDQQVAAVQAYKEATQWSLVPAWARFTLLCSLVTIILSCYMMQLFYEDAFAPYQLTYTIQENLDGDWKNLVLPLGTVALILSVSSIALLILFRFWAKGVARRRLKEIEKLQLRKTEFDSNQTEIEGCKSTPESELDRNRKGILKKAKSAPIGRLSHVDNEIGVKIFATTNL